MLLVDLVAVSVRVSATRSRKEKVASLAECLAQAPAAERSLVASYLAGSLRQRRTGLGWRGVADPPPPAAAPTLTVGDVDDVFQTLADLSGPGSQGERARLTAGLFARAIEDEQRWLQGIVTGSLRQGALDALLQEAVARAAAVPLAAVRRAAMLAGGTIPIVGPAFTGGEPALAGIRLSVGRPVLPMLAGSAQDVPAAFATCGDGAVAVEAKLDGIRIQVHRVGDQVLVATRSLEDITTRLPEVVELARGLAADSFVLDGEAIALGDDGRPRPFQETASRTAQAAGVAVTPYFFDVLHLNGVDLMDLPGVERARLLDDLVPAEHRVSRLVTDDVVDAGAFLAETLAAGHEGVVVKDLAAPYEAGRRGAAWTKVKPVHTLDLVVLAVEWGSGRRQGWLSNIHLGARDGATGELVMLGKTFKGMTDQTLRWQTERFTELALDPESVHDSYVVPVRTEQVVEIAFDGVQRSGRYPGGVALRFARVVRYRQDKTVGEIDTLDTVRAFL